MSDIMEKIHNKVSEYISQIYGDRAIDVDGRFVIPVGSALVQVVIVPYVKDDAIVSCLSFVARDVEVNEELMRFLLSLNADNPFGRFGI